MTELARNPSSFTRVHRHVFQTVFSVAILGILLLPSATAFYPSLAESRCHHVLYASIESKISNGESVEGREQRRPKQQWITCSSSKEIAHAIRSLVRPDDRVAELGSQLREVSTAICETIKTGKGQAVLVDTLRKFPKDAPADSNIGKRSQAMRLAGEEANFFPEYCTFHEIDRLDDWRQAFFPQREKDSNFDVFVLDVNSIVGNDLELTSLSLIREFLALNGDSCRLVLVKSLSLNQWASRLIHAQRWRRKGGLLNRAAQVDDSQKSFVHCPIVATVGVDEYRDTISCTVKPGDAVLEIGCHLGTSTALIDSAAAKLDPDRGNCGYCIGVDIGSKIIEGAQQRHSDIYFEAGDAWRTASLLRTQRTFLQKISNEEKREINHRVGFDVIYVDVGGLSGQDGIIESLSLLSALANALEPSCIVIKSVCVRRLSSTLAPYWKPHTK